MRMVGNPTMGLPIRNFQTPLTNSYKMLKILVKILKKCKLGEITLLLIGFLCKVCHFEFCTRYHFAPPN